METIGSRLNQYKGIGPGFDFLRISLACSVVAWHVNAIVTGDLSYNETPILWMVGYFILASFFGLSGFLIAGSALRLSLSNFLINRGLRIVPALAVEIVLSALILGPIFTTLALGEYFSNIGTWQYFTNIIGWVNYVLPGVFKDHRTDIVNNTLWTVPHEIGCYVIMSGLILFGLLKRPWLLPIAAGIIIMLSLILPNYGIGPESKGVERVLYILFVGKASRLYVCFILGIFAFLMKDKIPYSWGIFGLCVIYCFLIGLFPQQGGVNYPLMNLLLPLPMIYITAFLGVTDIWVPKFLRSGDYSYGIYLYGWPLQQVLVAVLPENTSLFVHFLLVIPFITLFAAFSWHFIERPILKIRKKFSFVARVRLDANAG
ncbi:MAG: acyltransferase family protein [Sphingorhabdus sp.]|uniref:acyltransferase family protein n=1 Tax=Sphingorhabdus sp. TaxID=1902408 RepID=UPI0038FC93F4